MKGNEKVIASLNEALKAELTAILQYILHSEMRENWGYHRLAADIKKQAMDEMKHAERLMERILFLDGAPRMGETFPIEAGATVKEQLERELRLELDAVAQYNAGVKLSAEAGDNGSRELFESLLTDEEKHVDYLEAQVGIIKEIGIENYLSEQMHGD